jgi:imidazoleglycerol phosphate synthase glutamine amidotransferase subunit HisH
MQVEMVIRHEGQGTYGLGEVVIPGVALFRAGMYNLTKEELEAAIKKQRSFKLKKGK